MTNYSNMPFLEHLSELRTCLLKSIIAIAACSLCCLFFSESIFWLLTVPLKNEASGIKLVGLSPAEAFIVKLKVSLLGGFLLASPWSLYQLWKFISPGLLDKEKSAALPFLLSTVSCLMIGVLFCYYLILPYAFKFFLSEFQSIDVEPTLRIGEYLSFVSKLIIVFALIFQLPALTWFLARMGIVTGDFLKKQGKYSIVVIFIIAAILTPPDIVTQVMLAGPLILLYGICILVAEKASKPKDS